MKKKLLVVGDIILDKYTITNFTKISQEAPVPVVETKSIDFKLGGAANVALNLRNLNNEVTLIGIIGKDENGSITKNLLKQNKIKFIGIEAPQFKTITKNRFVCKNQQLLRLDLDTNWSKFFSQLIKIYSKVIKMYDAIILSDYDKGTLNKIPSLISLAKKYKKKIYVDPKKKDIESYRNTELITPNLLEWETIASNIKIEEHRRIYELQDKYNIKNILITLGQDGMILFSKNKSYSVKAINKKVYDVSGAGDTVISVMAHNMTKGFNATYSMEIANLAAGNVVSKFGTTAISFDDHQSLTYSNKKKLINEDQINLIDRKSKKIVFTNGCFDIIHFGHIELLKKAKKFGDILIVAVNSDQSVQNLKGINRPINRLSSRLIILESLNMIDYLIVFEERTPIKLIKKIKPDFLVKGSDYKKDDVVGAQFIEKYGGKVKIIKRIKKISTSILNKKIN